MVPISMGQHAVKVREGQLSILVWDYVGIV